MSILTAARLELGSANRCERPIAVATTQRPAQLGLLIAAGRTLTASPAAGPHRPERTAILRLCHRSGCDMAAPADPLVSRRIAAPRPSHGGAT